MSGKTKEYSPKEIVDLIAYGADIKRDFPEDYVPVQMAEALQQLYNQQYAGKTVAETFTDISIREQIHWLRTQDKGMAARMLEQCLDAITQTRKVAEGFADDIAHIRVRSEYFADDMTDKQFRDALKDMTPPVPWKNL